MKFTNIILILAAPAAAKHPDPVPLGGKKAGGLLRAFNQDVIASEPVLSCDSTKYQGCFDDDYNVISCGKLDSGGCICPEGLAKCERWGAMYGAECLDVDEVCCNQDTHETCYDDDWNPVSCALIADGGCPCPEEEAKCGAQLPSYPGYCTTLCCDDETQEKCYDDDYDPVSCAPIADGGCPCPEGEAKCGADLPSYPGYCITLCCDYETEETCYDGDYDPVSCALIADGGCPCSEGEAKCGAQLPSYPGYCAPEDFCCDFETEESCYETLTCAKIADGGCPCGEGEERCFADLENGYLGECHAVCCDDDKGEVYCVDDDFKPFCAANECPSNARSYDMQKDHVAMFIQAKGTPKEISYFHILKSEQKKTMVAESDTSVNSAKLSLEKKVMALFRTIKLREANTVDENEISFMKLY